MRQSNLLYETHFVHCEEVDNIFEQRIHEAEVQESVPRTVEGYVQEARLSRWSVDFNESVILPLLALG